MRTLLITGSDTGIGKTQATAALVRLLASEGSSVRIAKVVETGRDPDDEGDAERARRLSEMDVPAGTLLTFAAPLAPPLAAAGEGRVLAMDDLVAAVRAIAPCDWCLLEGAGGIATPVDSAGRDWADFAVAVGVDAVVIVVPDRLGAINQARLAHGHALRRGLCAGVLLSAAAPVDPATAASNREGLRAAGIPLWGSLAHGGTDIGAPVDLRAVLSNPREGVAGEDDAGPGEAPPTVPGPSQSLAERIRNGLEERRRLGLLRTLKVTTPAGGVLNLADNDYLCLARDPVLAAAAAAAAAEHGTSASASPLITGWREPHERLVEALCRWHGFTCGLLWTSGYAANCAVLGTLPRAGDLVFADRLIHHSMIAGILHSGARLRRHEHLDDRHLEKLLAGTPPGRAVFAASESLYSMDGDLPDLARMAELRRRHGFFWVVDEAHALGWYGPGGAGLVRGAGVQKDVDVLVGTLGKTLGGGGAYTLFRDRDVRDHLINNAGEFIYSTAMPPVNAAVALAALARVEELSAGQGGWQGMSRRFRARLKEDGWEVPEGDSPIIPVRVGDAAAAVSLAAALREDGILVGAVRPPTVPAGTSRLRLSLKRTLGDADIERVAGAMKRWRDAR